MKANDFTPKQLARLDRTARIVTDYQATNPDGSRKYLTKQLAADYGVSESTVLRAAQSRGVGAEPRAGERRDHPVGAENVGMAPDQDVRSCPTTSPDPLAPQSGS
jgi:hypothetical protein